MSDMIELYCIITYDFKKVSEYVYWYTIWYAVLPPTVFPTLNRCFEEDRRFLESTSSASTTFFSTVVDNKLIKTKTQRFYSLVGTMTDKCILLFSSLATDQIQLVNSRRLEDVLLGNKIQFDKVDGSLVENKEIRDKLFASSGLRGKYPQCFLESDGVYRFIGLWDQIEELVESDTIPADVLAANPSIQTFKAVRTVVLIHETD